MKILTPTQCSSIEDVRASIDTIDHEIIKLFGLRQKYVNEIVKFKSDPESVVALDRQKVVIDQISAWAKDNGLSEELFRTIYQALINKNVAHELELMQKHLQKM